MLLQIPTLLGWALLLVTRKWLLMWVPFMMLNWLIPVSSTTSRLGKRGILRLDCKTKGWLLAKGKSMSLTCKVLYWCLQQTLVLFQGINPVPVCPFPFQSHPLNPDGLTYVFVTHMIIRPPLNAIRSTISSSCEFGWMMFHQSIRLHVIKTNMLEATRSYARFSHRTMNVLNRLKWVGLSSARRVQSPIRHGQLVLWGPTITEPLGKQWLRCQST